MLQIVAEVGKNASPVLPEWLQAYFSGLAVVQLEGIAVPSVCALESRPFENEVVIFTLCIALTIFCSVAPFVLYLCARGACCGFVAPPDLLRPAAALSAPLPTLAELNTGMTSRSSASTVVATAATVGAQGSRLPAASATATSSSASSDVSSLDFVMTNPSPQPKLQGRLEQKGMSVAATASGNTQSGIAPSAVLPSVAPKTGSASSGCDRCCKRVLFCGLIRRKLERMDLRAGSLSLLAFRGINRLAAVLLIVLFPLATNSAFKSIYCREAFTNPISAMWLNGAPAADVVSAANALFAAEKSASASGGGLTSTVDDDDPSYGDTLPLLLNQGNPSFVCYSVSCGYSRRSPGEPSERSIQFYSPICLPM